MRFLSTLIGATCFAAALWAADPPTATVGNVLDGQLKSIESEVVSLADAMPGELYTFAPKQGEFKNARTFAQQAKHIAFVNYVVSSAVLGEKNPSTTGANENGPDEMKTKAEIVKYLKDSFAYAHKAMQSVTTEGSTQMIASPFGQGKMAKVGAANVAIWHSFDHYGQMAVYARMNSVVPPASRQ